MLCYARKTARVSMRACHHLAPHPKHEQFFSIKKEREKERKSKEWALTHSQLEAARASRKNFIFIQLSSPFYKNIQQKKNYKNLTRRRHVARRQPIDAVPHGVYGIDAMWH